MEVLKQGRRATHGKTASKPLQQPICRDLYNQTGTVSSTGVAHTPPYNPYWENRKIKGLKLRNRLFRMAEFPSGKLMATSYFLHACKLCSHRAQTGCSYSSCCEGGRLKSPRLSCSCAALLACDGLTGAAWESMGEVIGVIGAIAGPLLARLGPALLGFSTPT